MSTLLLKNILLNGSAVDVLIEGNRFKQIAAELHSASASCVIDGKGKAIVPAFYNTHTHTGMNLLRGYADDMRLFKWLQEYIWPAEAKMTDSDMILGSRLAMLEMIKSGIVFFNDMYWLPMQLVPYIKAMGMRAALGQPFLENETGKLIPRSQALFETMRHIEPTDMIQFNYAPHAVYTVGEKRLREIAEMSTADGRMIHVHASETKTEVMDCISAHGMTPIAWLGHCGLLSPKTILAHAVHLTDEDIRLIREHGCSIAHNPCSNFKLVSGQMRLEALSKAGIRITLGTDSNCSNNNLSMFDEMKIAAFSAKNESENAECCPANDIWAAATKNGAEAFEIDAGEIAEGRLADAILIDMNHVLMTPCYNIASNMVYSADTSCIDTVICNGRIIMQGRKVEGEEEIIAEAKERAKQL